MWNEDHSSDGSATPPLPTRSPAPPPPPTFYRSHSLGKNESKLSPHEDSNLSLLGRHTHHYPNPTHHDVTNLEISKVIYQTFCRTYSFVAQNADFLFWHLFIALLNC